MEMDEETRRAIAESLKMQQHKEDQMGYVSKYN